MKKYLFIDNNQSDIKADAIGSGNKNFHIYKNPTGMVEAIKNGWSWPGFFNSSLWLIYKGMFILALKVFVFFALLVLFRIPEQIAALVSIGIGIYFGVNGNSLYRQFLEKQGYKFFLSVNADNIANAKAQFVEHMQITNEN
tara:strand:- start:347 stop:769 length:423 start_codon:yes stop_codon:yes gene_type:complete